MVSVESLREQFDEIGVDANDDIVDKCLELCAFYNIKDPAEFVEHWTSFSISYLEGAEPTLEFLDQLENKELRNKNVTKSKEPVEYRSKLEVHHESDDEDNEILGAYICITPKNDKKAASKLQHRTPDVTKATTFSPVSYSPSTTTKRPRIESAKSGNVVYSFGNFAAGAAEPRNTKTIEIKLSELNDKTQWINEKTQYMMVLDTDIGRLLAERIFNIGKEITKKIQSDEKKTDDQLVLSHCDVTSQEHIRCLGKIFCSGRASQLSQKSCLFIGFDENKLRTVQLDFSKLPSAQVFPGEICIIGGNNPRGKIFYVTELYTDRILEKCALPSPQLLTAPVHIMIASAPFVAPDSLQFDYLEKVLVSCLEHKPDVLILTGGFFPVDSKQILDVSTDLDEHFKQIQVGISERVGKDTQVVIVSSYDDINSSACYPTKPYKGTKLLRHPNIMMTPDPSIIEINGIHIGLTSVDVSQQLADAEFCMNAGADKIRRYMNYLFHQMSFYPLFPPKVPTDMRLLHEYATINKIPNILVVPSDMNCYMRDINGCLCINPGRVSKGDSVGTIARIIVQPPKDAAKTTSSWISGQILYI